MKTIETGNDYLAYSYDFCEKLYNIRVCGIPLSFYVLDLRKTDTCCHMMSSMIALHIDGAIRVEGKLPEISAEDKSHSWVEIGDKVYDTTLGSVWKKDIYYKVKKPQNVRKYTNEELKKEFGKYLGFKDNCNEMYIAWIKDILTNIKGMPYGVILREHINRLWVEKELDKYEIDNKLVNEYYDQLLNTYRHIEEFKNVAMYENKEHITKDELIKILYSLKIGNPLFFSFLQGKVKSYPLGVDEFGWGCFPITDENGILKDIRVLVPKIVDEGTLLVNIHELTHAYELFFKLGSVYIEDRDKSEEYARGKETEYLKMKYNN